MREPGFRQVRIVRDHPLVLTAVGLSAVFAFSLNHNLLGGHFWVAIMTLISAFGYYLSRMVENPERYK
jgi:hypothetical protein